MCRKLLAVFLSILFFFLFTATLYVYNVKLVFLNPQTYHTLIQKGNISQAISSILGNLLSSSLQIQDAGQKNIRPVSQGDLAIFTSIMNEAFSPEWVDQELGGLVDNFFEWFYSDKEELELIISFKDIKRNLGLSLGELFEKSLKKMPQCTSAELQKLAQGDTEVLCLPPDISEREIEEFFSKEDALVEILENIPDEVNLLNLGGDESRAKANMEVMNKFRDYAHFTFLLLYIATTGIFFILVFIALLIWKPFHSVLKNLGTTILPPSAVILISSVVAQIFSRSFKFSTLMKFSGVNVEGALDPSLLDGIGSLSSDLISHFTLYKIIEGGAGTIIGIALLVIALVLKRMKRNV